jgi:DNA-binding NtrC family response regulator
MLRAVEYGEVQRVGSLEARKANVFAIAATNRDLREWSAQGKFRSDLYFRLSTIELHIPPLRERREDIPYLTAAFIREFATKLNRPIKGITAQAERLLQQAQWTGNVRELRNVVERACILTDSRIVTEREMTTALSTVPTGAAGVVSGFSGTGDVASSGIVASPGDVVSSGNVVSGFSRTSMDEGRAAIPTDEPDRALMTTAQREQILRVLQQVGGNKVQAAKQLGMSRRSLYRWIDRLGVAGRNTGSS